MNIYFKIIDPQLEELPILMLSSVEKTILSGFVFIEDKITYATNQIIKRIVVGRKLGIPPEKVTFKKDSFGKQRVSEKFDFSTSRTRGATVVGISENNIGVDIERLNNLSNYYMSYKEAFLCDEECTFISNDQELIMNWTLKESFLKYIGKGLSIRPSSFGFKIVDESRMLYLSSDSKISHDRCSYCTFIINKNYCVSVSFTSGKETLNIYLLNENVEFNLICNTSENKVQVIRSDKGYNIFR